MIFLFQDTLVKLWNEARGDFLGGLLAAIVLAIAGVVLAIFRKSILLLLKKLFNLEPAASPAQAAPQPVQLPPQPVIVKVEGVSSPPAQERETSPPIPRGTIPRPPLAGFVARRDESGRDIVERLKEELLPEKEQLIVLWGAGGVGKTTLAAETARAMRNAFAGGIVWTTADGKPEFALATLLDEIATQLGRPELRQLAPESKDESVQLLLSNTSDILIVLDNFETIAPHEQERCANWLANRASCPALITSRNQVSPARAVRILAMSITESREFLQRLLSQVGNPQAFERLDHEQIIQTADRIPQVLQWLVRQIDSAREPQTVLDELSHGEGDAAKRVFDRSYDLPQLGEDGRTALLALSLFVPSASRVALAEVVGVRKRRQRLDRAVQQLAELGLIQTTDANERLKVEGLTRELSKSRFEKDVRAKAFRQQFVAFFLTYAEGHAERGLENFEALDAEKDNLLSAMDMAFDLGDWSSVQDFSSALGHPVDGWLSVVGYWKEALKANLQGLEASRKANSQRNISVFAHNSAIMHHKRGETVEALPLAEESLDLAKKFGDERIVAFSLHTLAMVMESQDNLSRARELLDESLRMKRKLNDPSIASSLHELAYVVERQGDRGKAKQLYQESLEFSRANGHQYGIAVSLHQLAMIEQYDGDIAEARRLYLESLEIKKAQLDLHGIGSSLHQLGKIAEQEGNHSEAVRLYSQALEIYERVKSPYVDMARRSLARAKNKI